jgi:hypothetical protein
MVIPAGEDKKAGLTLHRPARYRDRGVRYSVTVDGVPLKPTLLPNAEVTVSLPVGLHRIGVSKVGGTWEFVAEFTLEFGVEYRLEVIPGRWIKGSGNPLIFDPNLATAVSGKRVRKA